MDTVLSAENSSSDYVEPINPEQKEIVVQRTEHWMSFAEQELDVKLRRIPIDFDLSGSTAGMYQYSRKMARIRYNPYLFAKYFDENIEGTIPHEVAHYVVHQLCGRVKPHGDEWREVMALFGADDSVTSSFNLDGIAQRQYQRIDYICGCQHHQLTLIRHRRAMRGVQYLCRQCGQVLRYVNNS